MRDLKVGDHVRAIPWLIEMTKRYSADANDSVKMFCESGGEVISIEEYTESSCGPDEVQPFLLKIKLPSGEIFDLVSDQVTLDVETTLIDMAERADDEQ